MANIGKPPCDEAVILGQPCAFNRSGSGTAVLAATILGSSMAFIDSTVVNVALPALQSAFAASAASVQWVVESYALFLAALLLAGGSLGDLYGRRLVYLCGVLLFALASIWCGLAPSIEQLIVARACQGVGGALLVPGSLALISASFSEEERGAAIGTWSGFTAITAAIGPVIGGWLVQHVSWRWVFFINVPISIAVVVLALTSVPESRNPDRSQKLDWLGATLVTLGLGAMVFALIEFAQQSLAVTAAWVVGLASLVAFWWWESRAPAPMLPLALFRSRTFSGANLLTLFLYAGLGGVLFFLPLNLIQVQRYSATMAGGALLPFVLLLFFLSRWSGGLVARYGARLPLIIGPAIAGAGFACLAVLGSSGSYWKTVFPSVLVLGLGMALSVAPLTTVVMNAVTRDRAGTASGINNAVSRIAGLLAIAVFGLILFQVFDHSLTKRLDQLSLPTAVRQNIDAHRLQLAAIRTSSTEGQQAIAAAFVDGYRVVLWTAVALALASAVSGAVLIEPHEKSR